MYNATVHAETMLTTAVAFAICYVCLLAHYKLCHDGEFTFMEKQYTTRRYPHGTQCSLSNREIPEVGGGRGGGEYLQSCLCPKIT